MLGLKTASVGGGMSSCLTQRLEAFPTVTSDPSANATPRSVQGPVMELADEM